MHNSFKKIERTGRLALSWVKKCSYPGHDKHDCWCFRPQALLELRQTFDWLRAHRGRDKMATILQTTFSIAFFKMKIYKFWLQFHRHLFPRAQLTFRPWFRIMAERLPGDKPLSEPMLVRLPTLVCVTRPQWVKIKMLLFSSRMYYFTSIISLAIIMEYGANIS